MLLEDFLYQKNDIYINLENDYDPKITPVISNIVEKTNSWVKTTISKEKTEDKIFMEIIFKQKNTFSILKKYLKSNSKYFLCSFNYEYLCELKNELENSGEENVLLIAGDYTKIPLKNNVVDYIIDLMGSNYYYSLKRQSLADFFSNKIKKDGLLFTFFLHYEKASKFLKSYSVNERELYIYENILERLKNNNFEKIESQKLEELSYWGKYIKGVSEGEVITLSTLLMKKKV